MQLDLTPITAIGSADGRYRGKVAKLAPIVSEYGLMKFRVQVECEWFGALAGLDGVGELPALSGSQSEALRAIHEGFSPADAERIKTLEAATNHDVKAVEYFVKERVSSIGGLAGRTEFVHFACTSEDINNLAHGLMLRQGRDVLLADMQRAVEAVDALAGEAAGLPMLARTHGQPASPTTLAKELRVFAERLARSRRSVAEVVLRGKINGAVGNFNAHVAAYPEVDWPAVSNAFVAGLGLDPNPLTTQIEPHDCIAELFHAIMRFNRVLLDFDRDAWAYIAIDYFGQRPVAGEVGSSTMPHKVNPIDFENSEGNLGIANALLSHMADKLPVSRWQRDLSDSTVLRNIGTALAHCIIACQATLKGVSRLSINRATIEADLDRNWEVLAEAVQTVMRKHGLEEPYERLKQATRGRRLDVRSYTDLLRRLDLPPAALESLRELTPTTYTGLADRLAKQRN
ncbi:MAG: adenylosuccinate lyase [Gammaproteobacteria bacterium]|nr:adenylosuccinate lyase [Gammaproteobacteria bacterium]